MNFKKQLIKTVTISAVFTALLSQTVFGQAQGVISGNNVNMRSQAGTNAAVVSTFNANVPVTINSVSNNWYNVTVNGQTGFIVSDYVKVNTIDGTCVGNNVNLRQAPSTNSAVIGSLNGFDKVSITGKNGNFYRVSSASGATGFVAKEYISTDMAALVPNVDATLPAATKAVVSTYAIVTSQTSLNVRQQPNTSSAIVGKLYSGEVVDVVEAGSEWIKIKSDAGVTGYVSKEFVNVRTGEKPSRSSASGKGDSVVAYAKQFLGTPYVWGGTNLTKGVDCSGFVYSVYKNFGITLNRSSYQMVNNGVPVERANLQAGDLVFFNAYGSGGISHVGIYIGNGDYIHSSSGATSGVIISNLNEDYSNKSYVTARRVLR